MTRCLLSILKDFKGNIMRGSHEQRNLHFGEEEKEIGFECVYRRRTFMSGVNPAKSYLNTVLNKRCTLMPGKGNAERGRQRTGKNVDGRIEEERDGEGG